MRMETAALAGAEEVASLDYCALGTSLAEVVIRNTRGLDVSFAKNFATAYVSAIAKKRRRNQNRLLFLEGTGLE